MRNIIEYTLVSVDGVFAGAAISEFSEYRDEAYIKSFPKGIVKLTYEPQS